MPEEADRQIDIPEDVKTLLGKVAGWIGEWWKGRLSIREIQKHKDKHIEDTLELFERLFNEEDRIASSDLVAFLRPEAVRNKNKAALKHCLLIAKKNREVVALLKALYCPVSHYVLLSYFGIDKSDIITRKIASALLLRFFRNHVEKKWRSCRGIVFEIEAMERRRERIKKEERSARLRLFRELAKRLGFQAYVVDIDYVQPHMAEERDFSKIHRKMTLVLMPRYRLTEEHLTKEEGERMLWFLIMRIYGTTQDLSRQRREIYHEYLEKLHTAMASTLLETIHLHDDPKLWR